MIYDLQQPIFLSKFTLKKNRSWHGSFLRPLGHRVSFFGRGLFLLDSAHKKSEKYNFDRFPAFREYRNTSLQWEGFGVVFAIFVSQIYGPFFFSGLVNKHNYLEML